MRDSRGPVTSPAVKICGLTRAEDARLAAEAGADYLGVVLVPETPRAVTPERGRDVVSGLEPPVVAVVADLEVARAAETAGVVGAQVIQLHGEESPLYLAELRTRGPWELWKALSVRGVEDVRRGLEAYAGVADGIVLDGWHPSRKGGTGVAFSWKDVSELRGSFPQGLRLVAAGGLDPGNVEEAIRVLEPHVVDVSSGVEEAPGVKSPERVKAFILSVRRAGKGERR